MLCLELMGIQKLSEKILTNWQKMEYYETHVDFLGFFTLYHQVPIFLQVFVFAHHIWFYFLKVIDQFFRIRLEKALTSVVRRARPRRVRSLRDPP